jgi:hypothetical protein
MYSLNFVQIGGPFSDTFQRKPLGMDAPHHKNRLLCTLSFGSLVFGVLEVVLALPGDGVNRA